MTLSAGERVLVQLDGEPLARDAAAALVEAQVAQRWSLPTQCVLTFVEPPAALLAAARPGAALTVSVRGRDEPLFAGEVTALDATYRAGGRELRVRGYDRLHRLRKRQPVRAHVQVALPDLARALVGGDGIDVDADEGGPLFARLVQHRQTDFELLAEAADRCGLGFTLRGTTLHLASLAGIDDARELRLGRELLEASVEVNGESACRAVEAVGWDPQRASELRGRADGARSGRTVAAEASPEAFAADGAWTLVDAAVQAQDQAEALAQALLDRRTAREVVLRALVEGDPDLRPGAVVRIAGVAPEHAGDFVIGGARHRVDARRGYLVEIDSEPPAPRPQTPGATAALGVVSAVDDPDALGRVRVTLPTYGGVETDWLGVVAAGAGASKGLVSIPDVDDRVLVLLVGNDPAQGVVVGGLYGVGGPPEKTVESGGVRRFCLLTRGGNKLTLDDQDGRLRIEDKGGSVLELGRDRVSLRAQGVPLVIEAPGQAVTVRGKSIDFESA